MNLAPQQEQAFDKIMAWMKDPNSKRFVLSGYAGTGKTTLARHIEENLSHAVMFVAYTGKAVNVLREKGVANSSTIHSHIYKPSKDIDGRIKFVLKNPDEIAQYKLIIADEYSMISQDIVDDLESLSKKILYLGDPFQLPPVKGNNIFKPDFTLTDVHRQALDSNIIRIATDLRNGIEPKYCEHDDFVFRRKRDVPWDVFLSVDQILCGRHVVRHDWNSKVRGYLGYTSPLPMVGEKLICKKNNKMLGIFNGMMAKCTKDMNVPKDLTEPDWDTLHVEGLPPIYKVWNGMFLRFDEERYRVKEKADLNLFDFGHVITVHSSQGSEWSEILVDNDPIGRMNIDRWRWLYTAITRCKKKCWLVN